MDWPHRTSPRTRTRRRPFYFAVPLLLALSSLTACGDDPTEPEEPEIASVRLTLGTQTVTLIGGAIVPATIAGASTSVSATFLDDGGATLALSGDEFEIRLLPSAAGVVTFNRSTPFTGTLTRVAAGTVDVEFQIFHKIENHPDFNAVLNLTVQ